MDFSVMSSAFHFHCILFFEIQPSFIIIFIYIMNVIPVSFPYSQQSLWTFIPYIPFPPYLVVMWVYNFIGIRNNNICGNFNKTLQEQSNLALYLYFVVLYLQLVLLRKNLCSNFIIFCSFNYLLVGCLKRQPLFLFPLQKYFIIFSALVPDPSKTTIFFIIYLIYAKKE
jgi:hypothetical protein